MIDALKAAGFLGVEAEGETIHARLWAASVEFTVMPEGEAWAFAVAWPVRASDSQIAAWNAAQPDAVMDIHKGETRVVMRISADDTTALHRWAAVAEAAVAQMIRWRRAQRAPGEGM